MKPRDRISAAINAARAQGRPAIVAFITGGFPDRVSFAGHLRAVAGAADVVEVGVPFTDPMADGTTIQRSSRAALAAGTTLKWLLAELEAQSPKPAAPVLLMSYLNPLLAFGLDKLPEAAARAGVAGFIIPDLPYEESADMRAALDPLGLALVQLVTPVTPPDGLRCSARRARGSCTR
jgi:tryptophan synthase alpha chain